MSTKIKTIVGSYHYFPHGSSYEVCHLDAEVSLTRFFNSENKGGANIQLTVQQMR